MTGKYSRNFNCDDLKRKDKLAASGLDGIIIMNLTFK
jgi:hypothetical protein